MSFTRYPSAIFPLAGVAFLLLAGSVAFGQTTFTTGVTSGGNWQTLYVQGFSPSVSPSPNPGAAAGDTVNLSQFQFYKSGTADTAANIQLAIFSTMYPDLSTQMVIGSSTFVGLSTNTILTTAPIATGDPETFTFNNLPLIYGNNYGAIFVNVVGNTLTPIRVSALAENYIESPAGSGNFIPSPNYGGLDNFSYATSNFISGNFFNAFSHGGDALFTATLTTVPEPGCLAMSMVGLAALSARRRR